MSEILQSWTNYDCGVFTFVICEKGMKSNALTLIGPTLACSVERSAGIPEHSALRRRSVAPEAWPRDVASPPDILAGPKCGAALSADKSRKNRFPGFPTLTCSLPCTHQYLLYINHHSPLQHQLKPSNNPQSSQFWISIFAF